MQDCKLDHLVIAAATLEQGVAWVEDRLGVTVPEGGKHPLMGTHNCLMQIGGDAFLEIIAIDPQADNPGRRRWYALDRADLQKRLEGGPVLLTWVVRSDDIAAATKASPIPQGPVIEARRGTLSWQITVPHDGSMPEDGLFPTLIQWPASLGPSGPIPRMPDLGCRLEALHIAHREPERLSAALAAIGAQGIAMVRQAGAGEAAGLTALFGSPRGQVAVA